MMKTYHIDAWMTLYSITYYNTRSKSFDLYMAVKM